MKKTTFLQLCICCLFFGLTAKGQIVANIDNSIPINGYNGGVAITDVLANDTLNSSPVTLSQVILSILSPATPSFIGAPVPVLDTSTGAVWVSANTPGGTYTITYQICDVLNATICDDAEVTIIVTAAPIDALNDTMPSTNGLTGSSNVGNILLANGNSSDSLNGIPLANLDLINLTITNPADAIGGAPVPFVDLATGNVVVLSGTPAATYTITYQICEKLNPTNCDSAVITIPVTAATIIANDDVFAPTNGFVGNSNIGNVLANNGSGTDTLNSTPLSINLVTLTISNPATPIGSAPVPFLTPSTGVISVPAGTPAGTYTITYQICEDLNPTNCDAAVVTIQVTAAPINALDDTFGPTNGFVGNPNMGNVIANNGNGADTLNNTPLSINLVTITVLSPATPIGGAPVPILTSNTGVISIPAGTPAGTYTITYQICENLNPTNCDAANVIIYILPPPINIDAVDDDFTSTPLSMGDTTPGAVYANDTLNGTPVVIGFNPGEVTLTGVTVPSELTLNPDGSITVNPNTPSGTYTVVYQICEYGATPLNCDTAIATVLVGNLIDAVDDSITVASGATLTQAGSVLDNDTLDSNPATSANTDVTPGVNGPISVDANGDLTVAPNTPSGTYTITYELCETGAFPANCDSATVTIVVIQNEISFLKDGTYIDSDGNGVANPGDTIAYSFTVTNTTNTTLTNVMITDTNATVSGSPITLGPLETNATAFTAVHTITQSDLDTGVVYNLATVNATPQSGPNIVATSTDPTPCTTCTMLPGCDSCTMVQLPQDPLIDIQNEGTYVDSDGNGVVNAGDFIYYTYVVTNTGNVTLNNIYVTSNNATDDGGPIAALQAGASDSSTFTASHVITTQDIIAGQVDNLAYVHATDPNGNGILMPSIDPTPCSGGCTPLTPSCTTCTIVMLSSIDFQVQGTYVDYNNNGFTDLGDSITYTATITNNGNYAVNSISIVSNGCTIIGGPIPTLLPGQTDTNTFTVNYVLTQADINAGVVVKLISMISESGYTKSDSETVMLQQSDGLHFVSFRDFNNNGIMDGTDFAFNYGTFNYSINGGPLTTKSSSSGHVFIYENNPANNYGVSYTLYSGFSGNYTVIPASYSNLSVAPGSGISTYYFAIQTPPITDIRVVLSTSQAVPGFSHVNTIYIQNLGNQTISSGTLTYHHDPALTINTISVAGTNPIPNGFTYSYSNVTPGQIIPINVYFTIPTLPTVSLGQVLVSTAQVTPAVDQNPTNNSAQVNRIIVGSYDPNDKQEHHGASIEHSTFSSNDYLTYTIRFENTGTANAINVKIVDELDVNLDENTIETLCSSHHFVLNRIGNNLVWHFDGINLPPSIPNSEIGKGFVTFQVKPKAGFAVGDIIPNTADIYFDFNPAIITNTVTTEFVETLHNPELVFSNLNYFPNPVKNSLWISNDNVIDTIEIASFLGQNVLSQKINSLQTELDMTSLASGIYLVKLTSGEASKTIKIVKE